MPHIKDLYEAHRRGAPRAREEFLGYLYPLLHSFVANRVGKKLSGSTLQTTVILHDLLLILDRRENLVIRDMGSVYAFSAKILREYLASYYRRKRALKRGGDQEVPVLDEDELPGEDPGIDFWLDFDQFMRKLELHSPRARAIIDLRVIGGLPRHKIANLLDLSEYEVKKVLLQSRDWLGKQRNAGR